FTAARAARRPIARISRRLNLKLSRIGRITRRRRGAPLVTVLDAGGRPLYVGRGGYEHFGD
ncbi:MAG: thiamine-phosphate kinase, partial [Burkholderiales bacterium]